MEPTPSLILRADPLKTMAPILGLVLVLIFMGSLPAWLVITMGADFAAFVTHSVMSGVVTALYVGICLWLGYVIYILASEHMLKPTITLTSDGFEVTSTAGILIISWRDVDAFDIAYHHDTGREFVGWLHKPGAAPLPPWWQANPSRNLDASFGMGWQGSVQSLRDILEEWRLRHSDC